MEAVSVQSVLRKLVSRVREADERGRVYRSKLAVYY